MSEIFQVSIVRHTKNYEAIVKFYRDLLGMNITLSWDEPANRGTLLSFGGKTSNTVIEVIELGNEAVPGVKPVNVVLSIEVPAVDEWHDQLIARGVGSHVGWRLLRGDIAASELMTRMDSAFGITRT